MSESAKWRRKVRQGLTMATVVIAFLLAAPTFLLQAFLFATILFGAWEWSRVAGMSSPTARGAYAVFVVAVAGVATWALSNRALPPTVIHALALAWLAPLGFILACEKTRRPIPPDRELPYRVPDPVVALLGIFLLAPFAIVHHRIIGSLAHGNLWFLLALGLVAAVDTLGQVFGRRGTHRLVPVVSPKKTWEGLIGGVVGAALIGALASVWNRLDPAQGALLGLLAGSASVIGDLTASLAKRNVPTKDFSALLGQHGGVMDRVDGHLAAAPVVASILVATGIL